MRTKETGRGKGSYRTNIRGGANRRSYNRKSKGDSDSSSSNDDDSDEIIKKKSANSYYDKTHRSIEKNSDVFRELRAKQNPKLVNVDIKIYNELDKFNIIVDFISSNKMGNQRLDAFFELCKVFTLPDLRNCKDPGKQSSIYAIFFNRNDFRLNDVAKDIILADISDDNIKLMFDFFKVLIDVSSTHSEMLQKIISDLDKLSQFLPVLKKHVDSIKKYNDHKKDDEINSFESAVSPTADDLFHSKKIENFIDRPWETFNQYKKTMIDLTKENFYTPFRNGLTNLKNGTLDSRDLFLYENVSIAFTSNIDNYAFFKDCNFFLTFTIRTPPNSKKKVRTPDWKHTDQLGNRSLLVLSTSPELLKIDAVCRSCAVARSKNHEQFRATIDFLNAGIVPVVLISGQISENVNYYMFEPTSCWQAVQPVLQRLLRMNEITFPSDFLDKIIKLDFKHNRFDEKNKIRTDVLSLQHIPEERRHLYEKMATERWPYDRYSDNEMDTLLRVDHEQYRALKYALTHNLTLVNGAPGTGKTHFAREYLRLMTRMENLKPIAVVTFTNHALDSILEGILNFVNPQKIIRWGGPMRSTNEILIERVWKNYYLSRDIKDQKNEVVTLKQNLKNMYNIRQMSKQSINELSSNPQDINIYKRIIFVLNNFFSASKMMASHYPIDLSDDEKEEYQRYLNNRNDKIDHTRLPDESDGIVCWFNGEDYYKKRNAKIKEVLKHNREVVNGKKYHNKYEDLKDDFDYDYDYDYDVKNEEEEEFVDKKEDDSGLHPDPKDFNINSATTTNKRSEEDEEEEDESDIKIYNDEDIIEMTRVSYDGTEISEQLPEKYIKEFLVAKFKDLFVTKNKDNKKKAAELMKNYLKAISEPLTKMIQKTEENLQIKEIQFNENETADAGRYLRRMQIIGMTSTVASVRKEALENAGCEILIVEEAGELTESMLSCILPSTLKRLILIGDYQQLRPKVEYEMTKGNRNYDISLFEKLVVNAKKKKAKCLFTLSVQRRMHPQISALIRNVFYNDGEEKIEDADSTYELGIPFGIPHRVRFYMHNYEETKISSRSHANIKEAKFCASLVPFFICRGYKPEDITIISLYKGQMYAIQKEIDSLFNLFQHSQSSQLYDSFGGIKNPRQIKVVVLDNFQGEENKIIIVSLTRSDKPGFVEIRNRALVTLSRAREMLIVLGNEKIFGLECENNKYWKKACQVASELSPYSLSKVKEKGIAVHNCSIHDPHSIDKPSFIRKTDDIIKYRFAYCKEKCNYLLPCGHKCQLNCHCHNYPPDPHEHDDYYCQETCSRECPNGHKCTRKCGICTHKGECPPCRVLIDHVFEDCGHEERVQCYLVTTGKAKCHSKCGKKIKGCGHTCDLQCGHKGDCDCKVELEKKCENCGKKFKYFCGDKNPKCDNRCSFILPCGHVCSGICSDCSDRGYHDEQCSYQCDFIFPCGHRCDKKCCESFPKHHHFYCSKKVKLVHNQEESRMQQCFAPITCDSKCQHYCEVCEKACDKNCSEKCIERCKCKCNKKCAKCGAKCRALAGEKCAIFCEHSKDFAKIKEPPKEDGILFVFHDNHFLPLAEAKKRIKKQYKAIFKGKGDSPIPVRRLTCPCDDCDSLEPCLLGSWLFDEYNKDIETLIKNTKKKADLYIAKNKNAKTEKSYDKIHWYVCEECDDLFFIKYSDDDSIIVKCPNCGMQKGEMFE